MDALTFVDQSKFIPPQQVTEHGDVLVPTTTITTTTTTSQSSNNNNNNIRLQQHNHALLCGIPCTDDILDPEWKLLQDFAQNMSTVYRRRIEEGQDDIRWLLMRPRTSWDFIDFGNIEPSTPLFDQDINKETQIVEDLLNCFLGFHGRYISAECLTDPNDDRMFRISDNITGICRSMAQRLLPLASYYSRIVRFIQCGLDLNAGRVNQALAAILQEKIIKFSNMIVMLDEKHHTNPLDLNQIYYYLSNIMTTMKILNDIVNCVKNSRGGCTLSALHTFINLSVVDSKAMKTSIEAMNAAAAPYFQSISIWIFQGILFDPYDEFMIVERGNDTTNWDNMFNIKESEVPIFLKDSQMLIYKAGKYLDAVRKSLSDTEELPRCNEETLTYDLHEEHYKEIIKKAYDFANKTLRSLMFERFDLFQRIKTTKSFLCLEGGDLFHNIIDNCGEELDRPAYEVCVSYLPQLIHSSVETASIGCMEHADQMVLFMEKETLLWQVYNLHPFGDKKDECREEQSGMEALTFKVNANWPVSLVLHQISIKCYQMLFRHLFYLKRVHFKLVRSSHKRFRFMKQYYIRHIMCVFLQCCMSYMTIGTIGVHWLEFENAFNEVGSIEELRQAHDNMLYKCLQGCMLASPKLFHKLRKVTKICLKFADDVSLKHESPFISAVSNLINAALHEGPSAGLDNFTKEIAPIFQYEPRIALDQFILEE